MNTTIQVYKTKFYYNGKQARYLGEYNKDESLNPRFAVLDKESMELISLCINLKDCVNKCVEIARRNRDTDFERYEVVDIYPEV